MLARLLQPRRLTISPLLNVHLRTNVANFSTAKIAPQNSQKPIENKSFRAKVNSALHSNHSSRYRLYSTTKQPPAAQPSADSATSLSLKAVMRALIGNTIITVLKVVAWRFSGSSAMLAEAIHSFVDCLNQGLLLLGLRHAHKSPDAFHQYGYGRAAFFWSLISAMGVFWMGSGVTTYHGITTLLDPPAALEVGWLTVSVLGVSFAVDGYVFIRTIRDLYATKPKSIPLFQYIKQLKDPMTIAVLLEDLAACTGVILCILGIAAAYWTCNTMWDGIASIGIGALLASVAVMLIAMNGRFLIGRAVEPEVQKAIRGVLQRRPSIEAVYAVQSQWIGPSTFTYKAEIDFNGAYFAQQLRILGYEKRFMNISDKQQLVKLLAWYTEDVTRMVEREIDDIEAEIRLLYPEACFIELEPSSSVANTRITEFLQQQDSKPIEIEEQQQTEQTEQTEVQTAEEKHPESKNSPEVK